MKILHVCLASHYTEGMTYQDNLLPDQNARDGHETTVISDCYSYKNGELVKLPEEDRILDSGVRLIRIEYDYIINETLSSKIRKTAKLKNIINEQKPDVILYHGAAGWELLTVAQFKKSNPTTKLYVDSHQDFNNSGRLKLSLLLQYKIFNRTLIKLTKKHVDKYLYLSYESREFLKKIYKLKEDSLEFYPLGGNIISEETRSCFNDLIRKNIGLAKDDIVIIHSGKLTPEKKTADLITAFKKNTYSKLKLLIIGYIPENQKDALFKLMDSDSRIHFLGWKNSEELIKHLCTADLYFQPGTQSATMQQAICCGCPVALYPYKSHEPYIKNNGFFVKDLESYSRVLNKITDNPEILRKMSIQSYNIARDILDYKKLASRLYR